MGRARRLTNPGVAMGTPEYMAPEQAEGGAVDQRSDIYSVGALHLRDGLGRAAPDVARQGADPAARRSRPTSPRSWTASWSARWRRDPARRYQSMAQLEYDLVKSLFGRLARRLRDAGPARSGRARRRGAGGRRTRTRPREGRTRAPTARPPRLRRAPSPVPPAGLDGRPADAAGAQRLAAPSRAGHRREPRFRRRLAVRGDVRGAGAGRRRRGDDLPAAPLERARADGPRTVRGSARGAGRAQRRRSPRRSACASGVADVERMMAERVRLRAAPGAARAAGAPARRGRHGAIADTLATRAKGLLVKAAEEELDRGEIEAGVAHYRIALALDAHGGGEAELVAALRTRAQSALPRQQGHRGGPLGARGGGVFAAATPRRTRSSPSACTPCARTARRSPSTKRRWRRAPTIRR